MKRASIGRAALLAGLLTTVVVATPYVNVLNSCCCALVVLGGFFAAYVLRSDSAGAAPTGQCGMAGMLAGCLGGLAGVPLTALLSRLAFGRAVLEARVADLVDQMTAAFADAGVAMPPGTLQTMEAAARATTGLDWNAWTLVAAVAHAMIFSFFGLAGGLLGGALLRRRAPPAPSPVVAPPPPETLAPEAPMPPEAPPHADSGDDHGEIPVEELPLLPAAPERATQLPPEPPRDADGGRPSSDEEPGPPR